METMGIVPLMKRMKAMRFRKAGRLGREIATIEEDSAVLGSCLLYIHPPMLVAFSFLCLFLALSTFL